MAIDITPNLIVWHNRLDAKTQGDQQMRQIKFSEEELKQLVLQRKVGLCPELPSTNKTTNSRMNMPIFIREFVPYSWMVLTHKSESPILRENLAL